MDTATNLRLIWLGEELNPNGSFILMISEKLRGFLERLSRGDSNLGLWEIFKWCTTVASFMDVIRQKE